MHLNDLQKESTQYAFIVAFSRVVAGDQHSNGTYQDDRGRPARAGFFTRNESRYQCDISREVSVPGSGELIVDLRNSVSDRWKLRNFGLSTDVDKAVRNSNLNYDFRLPALGDKVRREGETNERCVAKGR